MCGGGESRSLLRHNLFWDSVSNRVNVSTQVMAVTTARQSSALSGRAAFPYLFVAAIGGEHYGNNRYNGKFKPIMWDCVDAVTLCGHNGHVTLLALHQQAQ